MISRGLVHQDHSRTRERDNRWEKEKLERGLEVTSGITSVQMGNFL